MGGIWPTATAQFASAILPIITKRSNHIPIFPKIDLLTPITVN